MAGIHANRALQSFLVLLFLCLVFWQFNTFEQNIHVSSFGMVGLGYNLKHFSGRSDGIKRSRHIDSDNSLALLKALKVLKSAQLPLCASTAILLSRDICPQPGPLNQVNFSVLSFCAKARGLSIAHLNNHSLFCKIDQLSLIMSNNKSREAWTFSETWLSNSIQDEEIDVLGYICVRRDRQGKQGRGIVIYCRES